MLQAGRWKLCGAYWFEFQKHCVSITISNLLLTILPSTILSANYIWIILSSLPLSKINSRNHLKSFLKNHALNFCLHILSQLHHNEIQLISHSIKLEYTMYFSLHHNSMISQHIHFIKSPNCILFFITQVQSNLVLYTVYCIPNVVLDKGLGNCFTCHIM